MQSLSLKLGTLFSGIGAPEQAAQCVYNDVELAFACEFDKFARESFLANYAIKPEHFHKNINDMCAKKYKGKIDILVGGSPCQSFSIAGLKKGLEDKRGQLIWQYYRIITEVQPPVFIYENVKGMVSDNNGKTLKDFLQVFREAGYHCHSSVLNTKDYGVPQNRERIFIVGFKDVELYHRFQFAPKIKLTKRLKDVLEESVEEKYYLSEKAIKGFIAHKKRMESRGNGFKFNPTFGDCIASSLTTRAGSRPDDNFIKIEGLLNLKGTEQTRRVYAVDGIAATLTTMQGGNQEPKIKIGVKSANKRGYEIEERIRKLTPRECLRLQDFPDSFKQVVSNSQQYKQAGNSMSVNVLKMIFMQIEKAKNREKTNTLMDSIWT
jgi:DNA (cytosine-5)-methyltransferase 1